MATKQSLATMPNTRRYIARNQALVLEYLRLHPCVDCGEADPVVLDFDHVEGIKVRSVAKMIRQGLAVKTLEAEMDKCVVRCANCHRRKTAIERSWYRSTV